jgi:hypothetical protein
MAQKNRMTTNIVGATISLTEKRKSTNPAKRRNTEAWRMLGR